MRLRARLERLAVAFQGDVGLPVTDAAWAAVFEDGRCATVVFEGPEPDLAIMEPLRARLAPWGSTIVSHPS